MALALTAEIERRVNNYATSDHVRHGFECGLRAGLETEATNDDSTAQWLIGIACDTQVGLKTCDDAKAAMWYQKAAEQHHAGGQYNLGLMYQHGKGVAKDEARALVWYQSAAKQGHANSAWCHV